MFSIYTVPDDAPEHQEQLGTKPKFWFIEDKQRILFKEGRSGTGENWAEKIAAELCRAIDLPHADYDLAIWRGKQGVVTRDFIHKGGRLVFGNELLARIIPDYAGTGHYQQRQHTLRIVLRALHAPNWMPPEGRGDLPEWMTAIDVFVGYLMLDAWIGNTDRHDENWGLIVTTGADGLKISLAPTFDHASCLGRELLDEEREARMTTTDPAYSVPAYARRARSALYKTPDDAKRMRTIEAFHEAALRYPAAAKIWIDRLRRRDPEKEAAIFAKMPDEFMTGTAKEFAIAFLNSTRNTIMAMEPRL